VLGRILSPIRLITVVATLLMSGGVFGVADTARADNCLTEPNSSAPQGSHWYYRTDRSNQRKCWYFRPTGQPAQQATAQTTSEAAPAAQSHAIPKPANSSAGAPMSIGSNDIAPSSPQPKMLADETNPVPAVGTATDKLVEAIAQEGSPATSNEPASGLPVAWPESPPAVAIQTQEGTGVPPDARADSAGVKADTLASNDAESTALSDEPTTNIGMARSLGATPQMFLIIALGLVVVGILSRIVMTIAAARRARVVSNHAESDQVDNQGQREWRENQDEYGSIDGQEEDYPPVSTARDYGPLRSFQTDGGWPDRPRNLNEVSKRDDTLAQLRQELDWLLQSERADQSLPSRDDEQNTNTRSLGARMRIDNQAHGEAPRKALGLV
jgi:hypothetical protein